MEKCSDAFVHVLRNLSILTWKHLPMIASFLSRVQFFAQWAVQKHRSDFSHTTVTFRSPSEYHKGERSLTIMIRIKLHFLLFSIFFSIGTNWILPTRHLQEVINEVSLWSHQNPHSCCYAPMIIQIFRSSHASELGDRTPERHKIQPQSSQLKPFLLPETHDKFCTVWYDWFV